MSASLFWGVVPQLLPAQAAGETADIFMATMEILINLDADAEIKAGRVARTSARIIVSDADVAALDDAQRVILAKILKNGRDGWEAIFAYADGGYQGVEIVPGAPTLSAVIAEAAEIIENKNNEQSAKKAKEDADTALRAAEFMADYRKIERRDCGVDWLADPEMYLSSDDKKKYPEAAAKSAEAAEKNSAALAGAQAADKKMREEKAAAEVKTREDWIAANGSERLRLCHEAGIECEAIYRDERLAADRPGWRWLADCDIEVDEPRNPPLEALRDLAMARKTAPDAQLRHIDGSDPAAYCAVAQFFGRDICLGAPEND